MDKEKLWFSVLLNSSNKVSFTKRYQCSIKHINLSHMLPGLTNPKLQKRAAQKQLDSRSTSQYHRTRLWFKRLKETWMEFGSSIWGMTNNQGIWKWWTWWERTNQEGVAKRRPERTQILRTKSLEGCITWTPNRVCPSQVFWHNRLNSLCYLP